ncbi:MAG: hypothetical protein ACRDFB_00435 [Rhabdochlamydiaceae bacterium]
MADPKPDEVQKVLVVMTLESTLLKMGKHVYDEVLLSLQNDYHCYLVDCYEHPEYLKKILQTLFGRSSGIIMESIKHNLEEFTEQDGIRSFIKVIGG